MENPSKQTGSLADKPGFGLLSVLVTVGVIAGSLTGAALASLATKTPPAWGAALAAMVCWALAGWAGVVVAMLVSGGQRDKIGFAVLAASCVRMLAGLAMSLAAFLTLDASGMVFWLACGGAGIAALAAETLWAIRALRGLNARTAKVKTI